MNGRGRLALQLLRYAGCSAGHETHREIVSSGSLGDDRQVAWIVQAGLGAMLYQAIRDDPDIDENRRSALRAADLAARLVHGNRIDTAKDVIDVCHTLGVQVTLLKGLAVCTRCYPVPHTRPMGDIDLFVPERHEDVEAALLRTGFRRGREQSQGHQHGAPLQDPKRNVWVEVHRALFPDSDLLRARQGFSAGDVAAGGVPFTFEGRQVHRLRDELQLAYTACAWIRDLLITKMHPSFLPPLFDMAYLVARVGNDIDWDDFLSRLSAERARASAYVSLGYLTRLGVVDARRPLRVLERRQRTVRRHEALAMYALFDKHVLGEHRMLPHSSWHALLMLNTLFEERSAVAKLLSLPWNLAFPPNLASRFTPGFHAKRLARWFRGQR